MTLCIPLVCVCKLGWCAIVWHNHVRKSVKGLKTMFKIINLRTYKHLSEHKICSMPCLSRPKRGDKPISLWMAKTLQNSMSRYFCASHTTISKMIQLFHDNDKTEGWPQPGQSRVTIPSQDSHVFNLFRPCTKTAQCPQPRNNWARSLVGKWCAISYLKTLTKVWGGHIPYWSQVNALLLSLLTFVEAVVSSSF